MKMSANPRAQECQLTVMCFKKHTHTFGSAKQIAVGHQALRFQPGQAHENPGSLCVCAQKTI